jgi:hypothetical protein
MIAKWIFVALLFFNALGHVALIGKPRKPITPEGAGGAIIRNTLMIIAIVIWWH